ncbi:MAG: hypothetical protein ACREVQ_07360 [Burkholderiales bacterium]
MTRAAVLLLLGVLGLPVPASGQALGRLFFTPEQREALDARRKARLPDRPVAVEASPTTRVDGYVRRSQGKSTVWLDGYAVPEGTQPEGLRVRPGKDPSRVTVEVGEDSHRVDLRVGDTLDRASGEVKDVLGGGEISIERRGSAPR